MPSTRHSTLNIVPLPPAVVAPEMFTDAPPGGYANLAHELPPDGSTGIRGVVLKVAERCNLACTYCYMYEAADQTYRDRPVVMSDEVVKNIATSMNGYGRAMGVGSFAVGMHGGEPFLRPPEFFDFVARAFRTRLRGIAVEFDAQTNASLITDKHLAVFAEHGIEIGVSLDGGREANDRERLLRGKKGESSFELASRGIERIINNDAYRHLFTGILCVVDTRNDPLQVYEDLCQFSPKQIDFLLPLGNWRHRPRMRADNTPTALDEPVPTPYADWLITIFDRWTSDMIRDNSSTPNIRFFQSVINGLCGEPSGHEALGGVPKIGTMFADTDGSLHLVDSLKTTVEGLSSLRVGVENGINRFFLAHKRAQEKMERLGGTALPAGCYNCDIQTVCGGGLAAHRYHETGGKPSLSLPSVYHPDLYKFIHHVKTFLYGNPQQV